MVEIEFEEQFRKTISKLDPQIKTKVKKQIAKIANNPQTGKPMRHERKGTREVYVKPFRISYFYSGEEQILVFLDFYHKDLQ